MDYSRFTAFELGKMIKNGEVTSPELCTYFLNKEDKYNAFISKNSRALDISLSVQKAIEDGKLLSPLAGVPVAVKDNLCTKGINTTCASEMLKGFVPPYSAAAVTRLESAGMIVLGKTNMDEFAMGSTNETSCFGAVLNPLYPDRAAGGSSGGSAAAVAGGLAPAAIGSDTGGSVRLPAAYCGLYGLKPTYGAVSRYGLIAYASSLDTVGALCRDVRDTACIYNIISGKDERDSTSQASPKAELSEAQTLRGAKIAVFPNTDTDAVKGLEAAGAACEKTGFPLLDYAVYTYYIIACAEASSNLARYDGIRFGKRSASGETLEELYVNSRTEGFGCEVKKRIMLGNFVLSAGYYEEYYLKALKVKNMIFTALCGLLEKYDFILCPVSQSGVPKLGESLEKPLAMYNGDMYNVLANLSGLPALSLPDGVQLIGRAFCEKDILQAAFELQRVTNNGI